ncbi:amidohydrolase family protein [Curtobacterium sp. Leaf183]|uniref:amidohydrolase family protein n=1 Tax=Curtobacterium sp. Leaf183 TaxID=1736291 RepID=UPI000B1B4520|nr:amidohydrolase family protein [Curtobacterium sp. Leaf183]
MIVDAHHHLWDPSERAYPWMDDSVAPIRRRFDADDLRAAVAGTDVTATIAVQAVHDPDETAWLLTQPVPVGGVVGWVDLTAPDVVDRLAALVDLEREGGPRLVGIRHLAHDEPDRDWLARDDVVAGVRVLAAAGMPFDLLVRDREHAAAVTLVDAVPDGVFVLDHAGKPDIAHDDTDVAIAWRARMDDLAARPNVLCKVSGLVTEAGTDWRERPVARYARQVVEAFGPDRSLFGSDWPVSTLQGDYAEVLRTASDALADLSDDERDAVFRRTAERVYLAAAPPQT